MSPFAVKNPSSIGVAFLGVGRMGRTHLQTVAGIRNVRIVVVAGASDPATVTVSRRARSRW